MIIRARHDGNLIVFELDGFLDFESTVQFQETAKSLMLSHPESRVVFNMERLRFVGSSGINQFIQVMKRFNQSPAKPKLCKLSSEFIKLFRAYQTARNPFEIFEAEQEAIAAFDAPPPPPKKVSSRAKPRSN